MIAELQAGSIESQTAQEPDYPSMFILFWSKSATESQHKTRCVNKVCDNGVKQHKLGVDKDRKIKKVAVSRILLRLFYGFTGVGLNQQFDIYIRASCKWGSVGVSLSNRSQARDWPVEGDIFLFSTTFQLFPKLKSLPCACVRACTNREAH